MYSLIRHKLRLFSYAREIKAAEADLDAACRQLGRQIARTKAGLYRELIKPDKLPAAFLAGFAAGFLPPRLRASARRTALPGAVLVPAIRALLAAILNAGTAAAQPAGQTPAVRRSGGCG